MNDVWIFNKNNCRLKRVTDGELRDYSSLSNAVINPDLSKVAGRPPHHWKIKKGLVVPKMLHEIALIKIHHVFCGIDVSEESTPFNIKAINGALFVVASVSAFLVLKHFM